MDDTEIKMPARKRRGRYSNEFKRKLIAACASPGVSTAAVALANGINANLLRRWITEERGEATRSGARIALGTATASGIPGFIRIDRPDVDTVAEQSRFELQLQRGDIRIAVFGSRDDCAAFVRAVLG